MKRKIAVAVVLVALAAGGLAAVKALQIKTLISSAGSFAAQPESVASFEVRAEKWPRSLTAIGSISAVQGVTITPEIPGIVREIAFDAGAVVAKGDLLVRLDTSSEEAQLRAVEAQTELARINLARIATLRKENTVSQAELDAAEAALKQSEGNADAIRATIAKKTIRAPFAGRLGVRQIHLGQYVDAGKPIVNLQALDTVYADFALPQQALPNLATGMVVRITTDAYQGKVFEGRLTTINPALDPSTRSVGLQATLNNREQWLRPGMFVRVEVVLPGEESVLVIPLTSILSAPYGDSVFVIEEAAASATTNAGLVVRQQFIRSGRAKGDLVVVESGLKAGQRVVLSGLFKLRNGMPVVLHNDRVPAVSDAPRPQNS